MGQRAGKLSDPESGDSFLAHVGRNLWLTFAPVTLIQPARAPDGRWSLGAVTVTEADLLAARPEGVAGSCQQFTLFHDGWRVAAFRLFRPLAYYAAFASAETFACLRVAVGSLLEQGGWRWEIGVITAPETVPQVEAALAPLALGERLHIATVAPTAGPLDWCLARYRIDAHPAFRAAQPLLYLDTDIVCDRPLEPLLASLAFSGGIHACAEGLVGEGSPESAGHWFGWRLMAEDGMPFDRNAPGFSAGALGMANAASAAEPFSMILRAATEDAARPDGGRKLAGLDQPFANYVLRKLGRIDLGVLSQVLTLHRLDGGGPLFPPPERARGLVHFLGAPTAQKRAAMEAYVAALRGAGTARTA